MTPSEAHIHDLPRMWCLPGSFPKLNFIKDWNAPVVGRVESQVGAYGTVPPDVTVPEITVLGDSFQTTHHHWRAPQHIHPGMIGSKVIQLGR